MLRKLFPWIGKKKTMKLVYIPGACSLAVHMALVKAGQTVELAPYDPASKTVAGGQPLAEITEKPYVPTLIMEDGEILNETAAILMSLDELYPNADLLPEDIKKRREAREWLVFVSSELHKTFAPLFGPELPEEQEKAIRAKISDRFDFVASKLQENGPFLTGETLHAPDMYLYVMTFWAVVKNISLDHWPSIAQFQKDVAANEAMAAALSAEGLPIPGAA